MRYIKKQVAILRPESRKTTACLALIATAPIDKPGTAHCLLLCAIEVGDLLDSVNIQTLHAPFPVLLLAHPSSAHRKPPAGLQDR